MNQTLLRDVPVVAIYNNLETFFPFLSHFKDPVVLEQRKYRGDRALFWLGRQKLVFCSKPIPGADAICGRYGYEDTHALAPGAPGWMLCQDILEDDDLLEKIAAYAGHLKTVQLIPYASTRELYQLARSLRERFGLTVHLPESPLEKNLWVRDYIDSKSGFRALAPDWITAEVDLPRGWAARNKESALEIIQSFHCQGLSCVVKPDRGESGLGIQVFRPGSLPPDIDHRLNGSLFRDGLDTVIIEEYFPSPQGLSPSFEAFVPPLGQGDPYLTYVSNQHFEALGRFAGVLISQTFTREGWYAPLVENGLRIAAQLQRMGYVGHFDLDTIIDAQGRVHLLEINARRTGGTYAHEFGLHAFGSDYLEEVTLLSVNTVACPGIKSLEELNEVLAPVLFPIYSEKRGLVITVTSGLVYGSFSCLIAGKDIAEVRRLQQESESLLARRSRETARLSKETGQIEKSQTPL